MGSGPGVARTILLFHTISSNLVLGPLNSVVWYVPSLRYTRGLGCRMHCGVEVTESSTNKQHHLSRGTLMHAGLTHLTLCVPGVYQLPTLQLSSWYLRVACGGQTVSRWSTTRASNIHPRGPHLPARWN